MRYKKITEAYYDSLEKVSVCENKKEEEKKQKKKGKKDGRKSVIRANDKSYLSTEYYSSLLCRHDHHHH